MCHNFYGRKRALILCMCLAAVFCVIVSVSPPASDSDKGVFNIIMHVYVAAVLCTHCRPMILVNSYYSKLSKSASEASIV